MEFVFLILTKTEFNADVAEMASCGALIRLRRWFDSTHRHESEKSSTACSSVGQSNGVAAGSPWFESKRANRSCVYTLGTSVVMHAFSRVELTQLVRAPAMYSKQEVAGSSPTLHAKASAMKLGVLGRLNYPLTQRTEERGHPPSSQ